MKAYTDLEQSKKLAEILSVESADMRYHTVSHYNSYPCDEIVYTVEFGRASDKDIPCWSLVALVNLLPFHIIVDNKRYSFSAIKGLDKNGETYAIKYAIFNTTFYYHITGFYNNPIDACVEMILQLNKLNLL